MALEFHSSSMEEEDGCWEHDSQWIQGGQGAPCIRLYFNLYYNLKHKHRYTVHQVVAADFEKIETLN